MYRLLIIAGVLVVLLATGAYLLGDGGEADVEASLALAEAMGGDTTGYRRATAVRPFVFPADYGPHPGFKTEWWYYTGNLSTAAGRPFGYELTVFRFALTPEDTAASRASGWATNQLYMAHFALTDVEAGRFYAFERFSRGALGLAGAEADPFRVWLEDWTVEGQGAGSFPVRLRAKEGEVGVDLTLTTAKPVVLQGDRGLDRKGPEPGNASFYYSFTRMPTRGTVTAEGRGYPVTGLSWKDHEWSTSALGDDLAGWDWFALHLSNGWDLMYYQLRRRDGTPSAFTRGTLVLPDGSTRPLASGDADLVVQDTWTSPRTRGTYPSRWRLRVPREGLDLVIAPALADQELDVSVRYWEGAVRLEGSAAGETVSGAGYVELTGYAEPGRTGQEGRGKDYARR